MLCDELAHLLASSSNSSSGSSIMSRAVRPALSRAGNSYRSHRIAHASPFFGRWAEFDDVLGGIEQDTVPFVLSATKRISGEGLGSSQTHCACGVVRGLSAAAVSFP